MNIILYYFLIIVLLLALTKAIYILCKKVKFIGFVGPSLLCFACGIGLSFFFKEKQPISNISDWCVNIAIPFMLFSMDITSLKKIAKKASISFALICLSMIITSVLTVLIFKNSLGESSNKIVSSLSGLFIGGLINIAAVANSVSLDGNTLGMLNASYIVGGTLYLVIVCLILPKIARLILPKYESNQESIEKADSEAAKTLATSIEKFTLKSIKERMPVYILDIIIVAAASLIAYLATGDYKNAVIQMLCITTFGIIASLFPKVRNIKGSYSTGQFLIDGFCLAMGMMVNFEAKSTASPVMFLIIMMFMQFVAALIHIIICRFFRVDADTAVITSSAAIFSPAFIPPITHFMGNKEVLTVGLIFSIFGFVVANYVGVIIYGLLSVIF